MLNFFAATSHSNYANSALLYLLPMMQLPSMDIDTWKMQEENILTAW